MLGIDLPDDEEPPEPIAYAVWQEHWPALQLFLSVATQWRVIVNFAGKEYQGLEYTALYGHPQFARLTYDEQDKRLSQVQFLEAGALAALNNINQADSASDAISDRIRKEVELSLENRLQQTQWVRDWQTAQQAEQALLEAGVFVA